MCLSTVMYPVKGCQTDLEQKHWLSIFPLTVSCSQEDCQLNVGDVNIAQFIFLPLPRAHISISLPAYPACGGHLKLR